MKRTREQFDTSLLVGSTDDEILRGFLDLIRTWRGSKRGAPLPLRQADVAMLVAMLGTDPVEIERKLVVATACSGATARRGRRLLLASVGALSIGLTGLTVAGALTREPTVTSSRARPVTADPASTTIPRLPLVAEAVTPTSTAVVAEEPPPAPVAPAGPTMATAPPGTEAIISVPSLGIDLPILPGGQSVIDLGVVAHYEAPGWEPAVAAGAPGTYWLAAHHVTHGGPFRSLPNVAVGAEILVTTRTATFVYTVTSVDVVGLLPGDAAIYGTNPTASVILLQTCVDDTRRYLVHGVLTATG